MKDHKGKLIDSDVMLSGVMQRCVTKELRHQLAKDQRIAEEKSKEIIVELGAVRSEIGVRTLFNFLGPLCNPAGATHQVIGVSDLRNLARQNLGQ